MKVDHPVVVAKRAMAAGEGPRLNEGQWQLVFRECLKRMRQRDWDDRGNGLAKRYITDSSAEATPTLELFAKLLADPERHILLGYASPTPRPIFLEQIRSLQFLYACTAGLPSLALRLNKGELTLKEHALLIKCVAQHEVMHVLREAREESVILELYENFLEEYSFVNLSRRTQHEAGKAVASVSHSMLMVATVLRSEVNAVNMFTTHRKALLYGSNPRLSTMQDLVQEVQFVPWEKDEAASVVAPHFGPRFPAVSPRVFACLVLSCRTPEGSITVLNEAIEQGAAGPEAFINAMTCCIKHDSFGSAMEVARKVGFGFGAMFEVWKALLTYLKRKEERLFFGPTLSTQRDQVETLVEILGLMKGTRGLNSAQPVEMLQILRVFRCAQRKEYVQHVAALFDRDTLERNPILQTWLDEMKALPRMLQGKPLGETASTRSGEVQNEAVREKCSSLAALVENKVFDSKGATPPWKSALAELTKNPKSAVPVFRYKFAGRMQTHRVSVVGEHVYLTVLKAVRESGGEHSVFWERCGDAETAVLLQVCRLRLVYSMSATVLGGFKDVFILEVGQTQELFREAGTQGAAAKWAWHAMKMFEDEADELAEAYAVFTGRTTGYTRATKKGSE